MLAPARASSVKIISGTTPIQIAATKLRTTAAKFGSAQKLAADSWIKKVTSGVETSASGLLEEQIALPVNLFHDFIDDGRVIWREHVFRTYVEIF